MIYGLPQWSSAALNSIGLHYRSLQDIEIYVEDSASEALYTKLIAKILDSGITIKKIIPLNGRTNVVSRCREYSDKFPAIFVIDGDFTIAFGDTAHQIPRLFRHQLYCMENYLFCEKASIELLQDSSGRLSPEDAKEILEWDGFTKKITPALTELFKFFAISWKINPEDATISIGYYNLCKKISNKYGHELCEEKIHRTIAEIKSKTIETIGENEFQKTYDLVSENIARLRMPLDAVSGKDYLLRALRDHLARKGANYPMDDGFKFKLARYCDHQPLLELKKAIEKTVQEGVYIHAP
ncbi:hypothetical protein D3C78_974150 [compost metagenome]